MKFSGISDEAGQAIEKQIQAHKELGWDFLEIRAVDSENLTMVDDEKFNKIYDKVKGAGLQVSCFASAIANWATKITDSPDKDMDELKRAIPRMHKFKTKYIRVMSWPNDTDNPVSETEWADLAINRMKVLAKIAEDGGVILAHENCSGWGGESPENMLTLLKEVNSPAFKLLYDTGNPIPHGYGDPWSFYTKIKEDIEYVHIKDYKSDGETKTPCYPGEGEGKVKEIMRDLKVCGYSGFISIEPHMASVAHEGKVGDPETTYKTYKTYGTKLMDLWI